MVFAICDHLSSLTRAIEPKKETKPKERRQSAAPAPGEPGLRTSLVPSKPKALRTISNTKWTLETFSIY